MTMLFIECLTWSCSVVTHNDPLQVTQGHSLQGEVVSLNTSHKQREQSVKKNHTVMLEVYSRISRNFS